MIDIVLLQTNQTITAPFCFVSICSLLVGLLWAIGAAGREGMLRLKRLHQIPCNRCLYFTDDHRLKCTVHPYKALTEEAIDCRDYELTCQRLVPDRAPIGSRQCKH